jgi:hypothetical protein
LSTSSATPPPSPSPSFINWPAKRKHEEEKGESHKLACLGDGISLSLPSVISPPTSILGCETLRDRAKFADNDSPSANEELCDKVEKAKNTVIPDPLSKTVSITINDGDAVLTYEGSRANLCESKLFDFLLDTSFTYGELIFSLCELDNNFNNGKGHSLETVVKVLQFLFSGRTTHLKEDSADQLTLLCSYLSLAKFLQSDLLFNEVQALFIRGTGIKQLTADQLEEIMKAAECYRAYQVIDEVLDFCIDFLRERSFFKPNMLSCQIEFNDMDFNILKKCKELIQNYGYLKRYLIVNLTSETTHEDEKVGGFYAEVCKFFPALQRIIIQDDGEETMDQTEQFNKVFIENLMPNLTQLLSLKLTIISPGTVFPPTGRNHILSKFISTVNSFPNKLEICLNFYNIGEEGTDTYQQHLALLENLDPKKLESLTLILFLECYDFKELAFMWNLPIQKIIFTGFSSDEAYEEDSDMLPPPECEARMIPNLQEISTYPYLKEVILNQPPKHIREAASKLSFKKLTFQE